MLFCQSIFVNYLKQHNRDHGFLCLVVLVESEIKKWQSCYPRHSHVDLEVVDVHCVVEVHSTFQGVSVIII